jgi:hypothetical protein
VFFILKLDSLVEHFGLKNCVLNRLRVVVGDYFVNPSNAHVNKIKLMKLQGV